MDFTTIWGSITTTFTNVINRIASFLGVSHTISLIIFWGAVIYLIVFLIFIPLHKLLKKQRIKTEYNIVRTTDEMIYLLARAQHLKNVDLKALWWNPNMALMKSIFSKGWCDYISSNFLILDNMHKVESLIGSKVIPTTKESQLIIATKKYKRLKFWENLFKILAAIPTLGIYLLFA